MRAVSDFWYADWPRIRARASSLLPMPSVTSVYGLRDCECFVFLMAFSALARNRPRMTCTSLTFGAAEPADAGVAVEAVEAVRGVAAVACRLASRSRPSR